MSLSDVLTNQLSDEAITRNARWFGYHYVTLATSAQQLPPRPTSTSLALAAQEAWGSFAKVWGIENSVPRSLATTHDLLAAHARFITTFACTVIYEAERLAASPAPARAGEHPMHTINRVLLEPDRPNRLVQLVCAHCGDLGYAYTVEGETATCQRHQEDVRRAATQQTS